MFYRVGGRKPQETVFDFRSCENLGLWDPFTAGEQISVMDTPPPPPPHPFLFKLKLFPVVPLGDKI